MTDIVQKLRHPDIGWTGDACCVPEDVAEEGAVEILRLRKGIQDYLDGSAGQTVKKNEQCVHGRFGYEGCENCTDEHFTALLKEADRTEGEHGQR